MPVELNLNAEEITEDVIPSRTYKVQNGRIIGMTDGLDAARQAVEKILLTQVFEYPIYDETYGAETDRFLGQDFDFVIADIERTIEEALLMDDRIESINDFEIINQNRNQLVVHFYVQTIEGGFSVEREVLI